MPDPALAGSRTATLAWSPMPLEILHVLARRKLPVVVRGIRKVEAVRVLVLSGHIEAELPAAEASLMPTSPTAVVTRITPLGKRMLQSFPRSRASSP